MSFRHWRTEENLNIATLTLDVEGANANVLSHGVLDELDQLLTALAEKSLAGVILRSAKGSFIVGADVTEFRNIGDSARAADLARGGQHIFTRLAKLPFPTVAVIHGHCLGGGLELALACTYRVAREDEGTRLGLPEVKLGIHPGFGGTVRLPPLVGDLTALNLMLTGRTVSARQARGMGLVDETVPERHLLRAAQALLANHPKPRRARWWQRLPHWAPLRKPMAKLVERSVRAKANPDHYPAPYRILDLWRSAAGQEEEARSLGELLVGRTSRNLVTVFLLAEELKRRGKKHEHHIERVHVIGAGVMGADIAIWAAARGFHVSLQDRKPEILANAVKKAHGFYRKKLKAPRAVQEAMGRLMPDLNGDGLARADLVIEAIIENVEAKRALFAQVEARVRPEALLASNTSSIPLEDIAQALKDPTRLVGLHFFNPVAQMQLVEIVRGAQSSEQALNRARGFTTALDRLPLDVKSSPGFLVNRVLMPYLIEAVMLAEEGVALADIDGAATDFGMPMGPILLADTVGLDICLSVAEELAGPLGIEVPRRLRDEVAAGHLGKKSGRGFYSYDKQGKARNRGRRGVTQVPITERLILRMVNESVACLREGVVTDLDSIDAGMVYGTGFAPYLGGPMRYAETLGDVGICSTLRRLTQEYNKRFEPDAGWTRRELFIRQLLPKE
ncbi:MAG TPA: 3-hydroxyacyl-CoA dehydrogenase NAD-binding domain-containing protein [Acidiferrobacterales bacterium]|nr:3-hydroxyacyl-CoA dehydrogenase NAD-binding domain-containing protein [Acidiferrobacterales bacterium]